MDANGLSPLAPDLPGIFARRPAVPAAGGLIFGIIVSVHLPVTPRAFAGAAAIAAILAALVHQHGRWSSALTLVALVCLGTAAGQAEYFQYPADDIGTFSSVMPRLVQLELRIEEPPRVIYGSAGGRQPVPKQMVMASAERILTKEGWCLASGKLLVQIADPHPLLAEGQSVRVIGLLERPAHATNPGEMDWAEYYRQERILTSIRILRAQNIRILSNRGDGGLGWLRRSARDLLAMGFSQKHSDVHALLLTLVLGDPDATGHDTEQQLQKIGVAYLLSVSGMHIAVVVACAYGICRLLLRSPRFSCLACLLIVMLYGTVALPRQPAMRAVLLCVLALVGILNGRDTDKLQLLSIAASILLFLHPMELYSAGCQLGFCCGAGLAIFVPPLWERLSLTEHASDDPSQPSHHSIPRIIWRVLRGWLIVSLIAWVVSLPIVAYHFQQLSPWVIPCGIVLFPVVTIALLGGCAKILLTLLLPSLARFWALAAGVPVIWMRHLSAFLSRLPGSALRVAPPSIGIILMYYLLICLPLVPWRRQWVRRASSGLAGAAVCALLAALSLGFTATTAAIRSEDELAITFLDIGAGQCAVLQLPNAAPALVDAGSSTVSDVTRSCLGPFLFARGDRAMGAVFLSHSDFDHISAVAAVLPLMGVGTVYTSHYFAHFASTDPPAQHLLDQLSHAHALPHLLERGDHIPLCDGAAIDTLWPPAECSFNCNNTGLVLRLTYAGRSVLFPADIQTDAMQALLRSPRELKADVLVAPHHGSSELITPAFVAAVDPHLIISSNYSPLTAKQKRFNRMIGDRPLYRTSDCGAITLHIGRDGTVRVETFRSQRVTP